MDDNIGTQVPAQPVEPVVTEPVAQPAQVTEPALPVETKDKTREEFNKLLESNRRLYQENVVKQRELEQLKQVQQPKSANDFVMTDPVTGERMINEQVLRNQISALEERTARAEQTAKNYAQTVEQREIERQNNETWGKYPELNPYGEKFDAMFNKQVRGILTDSFYNTDDYGGKPLSFLGAADLVRTQFPVKPTAEDVAAATAVKEQQEAARIAKEQASTQATSQPQGQRQVTSDDELENLRYRTRYQNDDMALAERLKHTEHIMPRDSE